ncbi:MAG TPA: EpsI family protein [Verrucomicrobiae bacterium]|nr:EpsI family protein [Verrucomicrobiae bacterium]
MNETSATTPLPAAVPSEGQPVAPPRQGPSTKQISIVVAILAVGVLLTATTSDVTTVSEPGVKLYADGTPFLAERAGGWSGGEKTGLAEEERRLLPEDTEGSRRLFTDRQGNELYCSIILAGRDVTSIHRPELCLPGQGWRIQSERVETIPVNGAPGGQLSVMRMNTARTVQFSNGQTAEMKSVFVYWFVGKGRVTPYHWQRIYWTARDRVLHNINHRWAYILIHVPIRKIGVNDGATVASQDEAMKVADRFIQDFYPSLVER